MPQWLGNGTINDPYQITTVEELIATTESTVHYYYKLMNDLDLSAYDPWVSLHNAPGGIWIGSLDGNNKSINNLIIKSGSFINSGLFDFYDYAGLFADLNLEMTESAYIKNLYINNALILFDNYSTVSDLTFVGILCARNSHRNISNVHINNYTCSVIIQPSDSYTKFLINTLGDTYNSTVYSCSVSNSHVEIIAANDSLNILNVNMLGSIDTTDSWSQCFVSDCYMKSDIWWSDYSSPIDDVFVSPFGVIYGYAKDMYVANTVITSSNLVVGLCTNLNEVSVQNIYTSVNFGNTPSSNIYPITRYAVGNTATNCYYESGSYVFDTAINVLGFTGLTTAQMKNSASYSGWDFNTIWRIDNV